jgi:DNA polymerase-3 subunit alpha
LLYIIEQYRKIEKRKTIKKDEVETFGIAEEILRKYSGKETNTRVDKIDFESYMTDMGFTLADIADCRTYKYETNEKTGERIKVPNSYSMKKVLAKYPASDAYIWEHASKIVYGEFSDIDKRGLLKELLRHSKAPKASLSTKLAYQQSLMGYISYTDPTLDKKYIVVNNLDTTYAPKFSAYCIATGKTAQLKVYNRLNYKRPEINQCFSKLPFKDGDILYMTKCKREPKQRKDPATDKWTSVPGEWVWWLLDYRIVEL